MGEVLTRVHEHADGALTFERVQDVEPILDGTFARRASGLTGSGDMRHAASLPMVVVEQYCNDNGIDFREFMNNPAHVKRMLNDPALSKFRVWEGRV